MANEKRLIDANAMREQWLENGENEYVYDTNAVLDSIDAQPTVDAVEVVRCKDCKRWKPGDFYMGDYPDKMERGGSCPIVRFGRMESDFCSYGERKNNEKI